MAGCSYCVMKLRNSYLHGEEFEKGGAGVRFIALKRLSIQVELVDGIKLKFACSSRSNKQATQLS